MRENHLSILISRPIADVFSFTVTPPNSTLWIPDIVDEKIDTPSVIEGTVYDLTDKKGLVSKVVVSRIKKNEYVEWVSSDRSYHCRYTYTLINEQTTKLEYYEWDDNKDLAEPFTIKVLEQLKKVLESS